MIQTEAQYAATKEQLAMLRKALSEESSVSISTNVAVVNAAKGQTAELAAELEKEIKKYEQKF